MWIAPLKQHFYLDLIATTAPEKHLNEPVVKPVAEMFPVAPAKDWVFW